MKIRKVTIFLILIFLFTFCFNAFLNAATTSDTVYTDDGKYNYTSNVVENKEIATGTYYTRDFGYTTRSDNKDYNQEVFMLSQKSDSSNGLKTVTWAIQNTVSSTTTAFSRATLDKIAEDYEKNHPGWKVLGGINADQYFQYFGVDMTSNGSDVFYNSPYYAMIADGEDWFSIDNMGRVGCNITGFLNNGTSNQLVYGSRSLLGFKLNVYDENNNFIKKFDIDELNPIQSKKNIEGEYTYLYSIYAAHYFESENAFKSPAGINENPTLTKLLNEYPISSENDLYIVEDAERAYVSNSKYWTYKGNMATDAFFGNGVISSINKSVSLKSGQFAIETTNPELLEVLKKGYNVVAQYEMDDEIEQCESGIGWHTLQRYNGIDQNVSNSYNSRPYPRSFFGVTSDGTIYLMASNGSNSGNRWGLYGEEINALCKKYNITTAFQMDGGGSVSMVVRNDNGGFDFVTKPADGNQRSIFSGLFFVIRDVDYDLSITNITDSSVDLGINITDFGIFSNIEKTFVTVSGLTVSGEKYSETKDLTEALHFEGLSSNTIYTVSLSFKIASKENYVECFSKKTLQTLKLPPSINRVTVKIDENSNYKISVSVNDVDQSIVGNLLVSLDGGNNFKRMKQNNSLVIENFDGYTLDNLVIRIEYDLNNEKTNEVYHVDSLNYDLYTFLNGINYKINNSINNILS